MGLLYFYYSRQTTIHPSKRLPLWNCISFLAWDLFLPQCLSLLLCLRYLQGENQIQSKTLKRKQHPNFLAWVRWKMSQQRKSIPILYKEIWVSTRNCFLLMRLMNNCGRSELITLLSLSLESLLLHLTYLTGSIILYENSKKGGILDSKYPIT